MNQELGKFHFGLSFLFFFISNYNHKGIHGVSSITLIPQERQSNLLLFKQHYGAVCI